MQQNWRLWLFAGMIASKKSLDGQEDYLEICMRGPGRPDKSYIQILLYIYLQL
jgi:hypothetical protein